MRNQPLFAAYFLILFFTCVPYSLAVAGAVSGQVMNAPFSVDEAVIKNGILTLKHGKDFLGDRKIMIFLFLKAGESVAGRTYVVKKEDAPGFGTPHVHVWSKNNEEMKSKAYMKDFDLRLQFGKSEGKKVTGTISLHLPEEVSTSITGGFVATIE